MSKHFFQEKTKKRKNIVEIKITNLKWGQVGCDDIELVADVHRTLHCSTKQCESHININNFLLDSHIISGKHNFYTSSFKDFKKYFSPHREEDFYYENRAQFNYAQQFKKNHSSIYLETCACGIPNCAGLLNGVRIYKEGKYLVYKIGKNEGYKNGILETGLRRIYIPLSNIKKIREQILEFKDKNLRPKSIY